MRLVILAAVAIGVTFQVAYGQNNPYEIGKKMGEDIGKIISGIPGFDNKDWLRSVAAFRRLGEMARTIRALEKRLAELE